MYEEGLGGKVDLDESRHWYSLAAEQGQPVAQYLLGRFYQRGLAASHPNYQQAKKWFNMAKGKYVPAAVALGYIYDTVDDNYLQAYLAYNYGADKNNPISQFNLGLIFEEGKGQPVDATKAKTFYEAAAIQGNENAMQQLAGMYFKGKGGEFDAQQALTLYKKAAELGSPLATYQLGLLSETGVSMPLDLHKAFDYYQRAANMGNDKAAMAVARMYQYGVGVDKNNKRAAEIYKKLARKGNSLAQYQLGQLYFEGLDGKSMPKLGAKMLQKAKANGSKQADIMLLRLNAAADNDASFIEPIAIASETHTTETPVELLYLEALSQWNRGHEIASLSLLDRIKSEFPNYIPAKNFYNLLNPHDNIVNRAG